MDDDKLLNPAGNSSATEEGTGAEKETLNAFQKFMKSLMGGEKDDPADKGDPADKKDEQKKDESKKDEPKGKSFNEDDLAKALEAEKVKWQEEQKEKERLAKLSPEEREKAEKANSEKRIADLEQRLMQKDLKEQAVADLSRDGFPVGLSELVSDTSKEDMSASLEKTKEIFKTCLSEAINQKLRGKTPAGLGDASHAENAFKDQIAKNIRGGF